MKDWPIRLQLAYWYTVSLMLMLGLFGILIQWRMADRLSSRTESELSEELEEILLEIRLAKSQQELAQQLALRFGDHPIFTFDIQTSTGDTLLGTAEFTPAMRAASPVPVAGRTSFFKVARTTGEKLRVLSWAEPGPLGALDVRVVMTLARSLSELRDLKLILLTLGLAVSVVSAGLGYWLAARFLSPLDSMLRSAERIQAVQSRERLTVINPHDEIGRLGLTLNAMIDRLEKSAEEQLQFTADAAHELRTPLAVIRSAAEVALRQPRSPEYYRECLSSLLEEMGRLTMLSHQLLELAREDLEAPTRSHSEINLTGLISSHIEEWEGVCEEQGIVLKVHLEPDLRVSGEPDHLNRVFLNILDNAVKYSPNGGEVSVVLQRKGRDAELIFQDAGIGISAEHLPHVFQRFYRADVARTRETGGFGLGLAIVQSIIHAHAGALEIASDGRQGTTVRILLPFIRA